MCLIVAVGTTPAAGIAAGSCLGSRAMVPIRFGLRSPDRYVCGEKGDPDHYAIDCPVTKPSHFVKPSTENLST
ncbi:hypothetical protein AVEN_15666-1 [Araneus ventricosus]|uniref:Uncharacterized protein n=1 Tax=Araneus ventricosus TaxID=182803 RepID=A0A4Y2K2T7_ARAVE|nr:hypothetical protein AVEN_15666-1 [Araneus ventricosus]